MTTRPEIVFDVIASKSATLKKGLLENFDTSASPQELSQALAYQLWMQWPNLLGQNPVRYWSDRHRRHEKRLGRKYKTFHFKKTSLLPEISVFTPPNSKGIALCLTGAAGRMMTTWPHFITSMANTQMTFVLVHHRGGYTKGIPEISDNPWQSLLGLHALLEKNELLPDLVIGSSAGCLVGVAYASVLHESEVLLFGPSNLEKSKTWKSLQAEGLLEQKFPLKGIAWAGGALARDVESCRVLKSRFSGFKLNILAELGHNCVMPLIEQSRFEQVVSPYVGRNWSRN